MPKVTICSLHANITDKTSNMGSEITSIYDKMNYWVELDEPCPISVMGDICSILSDLEVLIIPNILSDTEHAKSCGQNMENALIERKGTIKELNNRIEELEDRISYLESELDYEKIEYRKG